MQTRPRIFASVSWADFPYCEKSYTVFLSTIDGFCKGRIAAKMNTNVVASKRGRVCSTKNAALAIILGCACLLSLLGCGRSQQDDAATQRFETPNFNLSLQKSSQTLVSLAPKSARDGFDFAPSNRFTKRLADGNYRLGDIDLRLREIGSRGWQDYSSAYKRVRVTPLAGGEGALAEADITQSLGHGFPLRVTRRWAVENGKLVLRFTLINPGNRAIESAGWACR
jgi:hypothetical protein